MKRKNKISRGPIEYCKIIFWTLSVFKFVCSFYHVYWHPTLMDEYNKMQGGNSTENLDIHCEISFMLSFSSITVLLLYVET